MSVRTSKEGEISCFISYLLNKSPHCSESQSRNLDFICILHTLPLPQQSRRTKTSLVDSNYGRLLITKLFQWKSTNCQACCDLVSYVRACLAIRTSGGTQTNLLPHSTIYFLGRGNFALAHNIFTYLYTS